MSRVVVTHVTEGTFHARVYLETPAGDLSSGMQWLNGRYAQDFNHRHGFDGHLFQGRFYSGQVESDWHLLELSRYLARNPVEAGLCRAGERTGHGPWVSAGSAAGGTSPIDVSFLFFPPAVSLTALTVATVLGVAKPWGRIRASRSTRPSA